MAERVATERAEKIGETVGYNIRLDKRASRDTKLLFCTTGIVLRQLQSDPKLTNVSHVFIDEVSAVTRPTTTIKKRCTSFWVLTSASCPLGAREKP